MAFFVENIGILENCNIQSIQDALKKSNDVVNHSVNHPAGDEAKNYPPNTTKIIETPIGNGRTQIYLVTNEY
jgi:hypothetical protein